MFAAPAKPPSIVEPEDDFTRLPSNDVRNAIVISVAGISDKKSFFMRM